MRRRRWLRIRKVLLWGFVLVASMLVGAIAFAYAYITDSETLAAMIRDEAPRYLPGSRVQVDRVLLRPLVGDIELKQTTIWQTVDGQAVPTLQIPWVQVRSDFRSLIWGTLATREIAVAQPRLRIMRRKDGTWNLQGLLADPFPQTKLPKPIVVVTRGTVELADGPAPASILTEVSLRIEPISDGSYKFEGDARGVAFERLALAGTYHPKTGRLVLSQGLLTGLTISDAVRNRLPEGWKGTLDKLGLKRGEVDVTVTKLVRDPKANPPLDYEVGLSLRSGVWDCPALPFPLADLDAAITVTPREIRVGHATGHDGKTVVRIDRAVFSAKDSMAGPLDLSLRVENLELDERLRRKTPSKLAKLWDDYAPHGRANLGQVNARVRASRSGHGEPIVYETDVMLLDVAIQYRHFRYPLEHIQGSLSWKDKKIVVVGSTVVGGKPMTGKGTILDPGANAVVSLTFTAGAMPIDKTLLDALPDDARKVVEDFAPEGSVRGVAVVTRTPAPGDAKGKIRVDAELDLNENCSMRWKGLPYPVRNLTGRLSLHPDRWDFTGMKGENNLARIAVGGRVIQVAKGKFDVDINLQAEGLPFDKQLRDSLPREWRSTWGILNPAGSTKVDARIVLKPGKPDDYKIRIAPESGTHVQLIMTAAPGTEIASGAKVIELPRMDEVTGSFAFDNGVVTMRDVGFNFRQAPAHFAAGRVRLQGSGAFDLRVEDLTIKGLRIESELRKIMPKVMASFARRLDDGKTFSARGNLAIGWSGAAGDPASCSWEKARVVFNDNSVAAGVPFDHIQGEIRDVVGRFDGRALSVEGVVDLASVHVLGQHLTGLTAALKVGDGRAAITKINADFLGGKLTGDVGTSLDATPRYEAAFEVAGARLEQYAQTVRGHQDYKGEVNGKVAISGLGQDPKAIKGHGEARVSRGDLGKLPILLELIQPVNLPRQGRTKFDAAEVVFAIDNGATTLDPVKFTSDSVSLQGKGTVGHLGALDLRFTLLPGRNERQGLRGVRDAIRVVEGQFLVIHVGGTVSQHKITPEFLPIIARNAGKVIKKIGNK